MLAKESGGIWGRPAPSFWAGGFPSHRQYQSPSSSYPVALVEALPESTDNLVVRASEVIVLPSPFPPRSR